VRIFLTNENVRIPFGTIECRLKVSEDIDAAFPDAKLSELRVIR
jgi:hypothetical protein